MRILELFSGTSSFGNVFLSRGHDVRTLDIDSVHGPTYCMDIMDFDQSVLDGWMPDVIWASPDCSAFSVASISTHWGGGKKAYVPKTDKAISSINNLQKTIDIINELKPKYWFIENPAGVMRKMDILRPFHRKTVTYCQYGDVRMKPTDIWTNCLQWTPRERCKNGDPCHISAPRGSKTGTQGLKGKIKRSIIPEELCLEIYEVIIEGLK